MSQQHLSVRLHNLGGFGPALLLLHANGFHAHVFVPMVEVLQRHFTCIALDLPGHGKAPCPSGPFTWQQLVQALHWCLQERGLRGTVMEGCFCLGHSLGGALALLLEAQQPGSFAAVYAYEPVLSPHPGFVESTGLARPPLAAIARKRQGMFASAASARQALGSKPPFSFFHPSALDAYLQHGLRLSKGHSGTGHADAQEPHGVELCCSPTTEAHVYEALATPPCPATGWSSVTCPVVVAVGRADGGLHASLALAGVALAKLLPHGQLHRYIGCSHLGPLEQPALVAEQAHHFFSSLLQGGRDVPGAVSMRIHHEEVVGSSMQQQEPTRARL